MGYKEYLSRIGNKVTDIEFPNRVELEVYDHKLDPVGIITGKFSLSWLRKYVTAGMFELHCSLNQGNFEIIQRGNLLTRLDSDEFGIIEDISYKFDASTGERIVVKGRLGVSMLDWRCHWGTINFKGTSEDAIYTLVEQNLITTTEDRKIKNMIMTVPYGYEEQVEFQATDRNVLDQCNKLCRTSGLGINMKADFDRKEYIFSVYKGRDLRNKIILTDEDGNIKNSEYQESSSTERNYYKVKGEGEGEQRKTVIIDNKSSSWNRREMYIDARDLQKGDLSDEQYQEALKNRGLEKATEYKLRKTFDATTEFNNNSIYRKDWDLGDIITVRKEKWGLEIQERVTEVEEVFSDNKVTITPTFGSPLPELKDILKGEM